MGNTVIEKIIRHNTGKDVKPGDIVTVNVDRVMIHDIFIPFVGDKFEEMGFTKLWDPDKDLRPPRSGKSGGRYETFPQRR